MGLPDSPQCFKNSFQHEFTIDITKTDSERFCVELFPSGYDGYGMVVVGMVDMVRMRWVCYQKYCQVGLVAVGAVKMKRKILPAGSEDWPKDLIQEKLLEAVTCPNICLQVAIFYFGQN